MQLQYSVSIQLRIQNLNMPQIKWPVTPGKVQYDKLLFFKLTATSKQMTVPKRIKKFPAAKIQKLIWKQPFVGVLPATPVFWASQALLRFEISTYSCIYLNSNSITMFILFIIEYYTRSSTNWCTSKLCFCTLHI